MSASSDEADTDGYFGKAIITFRDRNGLKWTAGALISPLSAEGMPSVTLSKEVAEAGDLKAVNITLVYDDGA